MKNLLIIILVFTCLFGYSQNIGEDSIRIANIAGTDTVLFFTFYSDEASGIEFDYSNFNADDATLTIGNSNYGYTFNAVDNSNFPYTLDVTTNEQSVNGTTYATLFICKDAWNSKYYAVKLTVSSVTSGTLKWKWVR